MELAIPILPADDLSDARTFYRNLGFEEFDGKINYRVGLGT